MVYIDKWESFVEAAQQVRNRALPSRASDAMPARLMQWEGVVPLRDRRDRRKRCAANAAPVAQYFVAVRATREPGRGSETVCVVCGRACVRMYRNAQLFISDPENTRYLVKYGHVDAKLVLKVTDDKVLYLSFCTSSCMTLYSIRPKPST